MQHVHMLSVATLALALTTGGAVQPAPTEAANTLSVTYLYCEDTGGGGTYYNNTFCEAYVSGGTGSYTFDWNVIETSRADFADGSVITGVCTDSYPVTFTVTDSSGASASRSDTFRCYAKSSGGGLEP